MHAWFDISAGVAGDMLLGSLLDAGADAAAVAAAIEAVAPGSVRLEAEQVVRGGQRATKARVRVLVEDPPHRSWATIRATLTTAALADVTRERALAAFGLLADAEARAHGIDADAVHFHEVGALDSLADVVGSCEALRTLGVTAVTASPVRLGAGRVRAAHGDIPVPVPAVAELAVGWQVYATPERDSAHGHSHGHTGAEHAHHHGGGVGAADLALTPDTPHGDADDDHRHGGPDHPPHDHGHGGHGHGDHHHSSTHEEHHAVGVAAHRHDQPRQSAAAEGVPSQGHSHDTPAAVTTSGSVGELATPTGLALVRALAATCGPLPALTVTGVGVGAGGKDFAGWPNVVRVVLGVPANDEGGSRSAGHARAASAAPSGGLPDRPARALSELRANVDDLDPRLWPGVLDALLAAGAVDAWLVPILMKKGRPGFTLHALAPDDTADAVTDTMLSRTSTLGVRATPVTRTVLERQWAQVEVLGEPIRIKVGSRDGVVVHAEPEFDSLATAAAALGRPEYEIAQRASAALASARLLPGERLPAGLAEGR